MKRKLLSKKTRNDLILLAGILLLASLCLALFYFNKTQGDSVKIMLNGSEYKTLSLKEDTELTVKNGEGSNTVVIKNGEAYVKDATCPDKICEGHRAISRVGETIVCLPNKLTLRIFSQSSLQELDAVV